MSNVWKFVVKIQLSCNVVTLLQVQFTMSLGEL